MYNTFSLGWVEFEEKISKNLSVIFFENFWNHLCAFHIMKIDFQLFFYKKFQVFQLIRFIKANS